MKNTPILCWNCKQSISAQDNYCKFCGRGQGKHASWYYHHLGVLFLTFIGLVPFSLYFIIRSPIIGKVAKWIYCIIAVAYGIYISRFVYNIYLLVKNFLEWF